MKNSIQTLLDAYVHDNAVHIKENGGNVAEYILSTSEAEDQGWLWFLSNEEIEEYESNPERRVELIAQIRAFVNEIYNYNILAEELLEKWIVVQLPYTNEEESIRVTRRSNFAEMNFCKAYGNYGVQVGCYNAGCYSFDNSGCSIFEDFYSAITEKIGRFGSLMDDLELTNQDLVEWLNDKEGSVAYKTGLENFPDWVKMVAFFKEWKEQNENHTEVTAWTYHDSHNFKTIGLKAEFNEPDCVELDEKEQIEILLQMPESTPHIEGTNVSEESENFIFHFDRWATNPWFCYVERK